MERYRVLFVNQKVTVTSDGGSNLAEAVQRAGIFVDFTCGGKGTCGKCKVMIEERNCRREVLACQYLIHCDLKVWLEDNRNSQFLTKGASQKKEWQPYCRKVRVRLPEAFTNAYGSDAEEFCSYAEKECKIRGGHLHMTLRAAKELAILLHAKKRELTAVLFHNEIIGVSARDLSICLAAFDIGTTSLAGYLLDGQTGRELAVASRLNPQKAYGADVVSRASYETENQNGALTTLIRQAIDEMTGELCRKAGKRREDLYQVTLVGNTCMHHLFLRILPDSLLRVPYHAAMTKAYEGLAADYGICAADCAVLQFLPNMAGFVGADTVACLLAADFIHQDKKTLMLDIGTNGELVMGTKECAYTCSTAAGPALEGAKIACGMGGMEGAIQHVAVKEDELKLSVIGGGEAVGICGSGLIDAVSVLLQTGMIEKRGRIRKAEKLKGSFARKNAWRIKRDGESTRLMLTETVYLTQQDIREVQLAKSAIASGIEILCRKLGWTVEELEQVQIAGAFGNYMDPASACTVGLLPVQCLDKITGIGNAAGEGAKTAQSSEEEWQKVYQLPKNITFVELASEPEFQTLFVKNLSF